MAPPAKGSMAGDVGSWALNVCSSVGLIYVNKLVMSMYQFRFATTLTAMHFAVTSAMGFVSAYLGYTKLRELPFTELFLFAIVANVSIVGMNLSLLLNSVGFYQIAKLSMIPVVCIMERCINKKSFSTYSILAVITVVFGVAIVTVTDVTVNLKGFMAAIIAVVATALQQIYIGSLQTKHSVTAMELLSKTAPIQAFMLAPLAPFVDFSLTGNWVFSFEPTFAVIFFVALSCILAVGCNVSQYLVIGRFSAVSFQVLGHIKTVCILMMGWLFFNDILSFKNFMGMMVTVLGMVLYQAADQKAKAAAAVQTRVAAAAAEEDITLLRSGVDHNVDLELGKQ